MENLENENMNTGVEDTITTETKTYTEEEMQSLIDKRVSQALATQAKKNEKAMEQAKKLASLSAEEREKEQFRLDREEFERQKKEFAIMSNKIECTKILAEKGLSPELADFVVAEDAETMNNNIKTIEKLFLNSVKAEVEKRLNSQSPKHNLPLNQTYTKESFAKLTTAQRFEIMNSNPELYNQLTK